MNSLLVEGGAWSLAVRFVIWPLAKRYAPRDLREGVVVVSCFAAVAAVSYLSDLSFAAALGSAFSGVGVAMLQHNVETKIREKRNDNA